MKEIKALTQQQSSISTRETFSFCSPASTNFPRFLSFQARMKLPKRRRRVVAVEAPRRTRRGGTGSIGGNGGSGSGSGAGPGGMHRRNNAFKASHHHNHVSGSIRGHPGHVGRGIASVRATGPSTLLPANGPPAHAAGKLGESQGVN